MSSEILERPRIEKIGLGYRARFDEDGIELAIDRLRESRGQLSGELTVAGRRMGTGIAQRHLLRHSFSLSSLPTRRSTAAALRERSGNGADWNEILELFCIGVLDEHRRGEPFEIIGRDPPRPAIEYRLAPILPLDDPILLYAPGGTGKSTLAGAIAVSVASGEEVVPGWTPRRAAVLVLDWEANRATWNDRIARIATGAGIEPPQIAYRSARGRSLPEQLEEVSRHVAQHRVGLLVADSVGLATPSGREGSDANEGALSLFRALDAIGTAALLIDHVRGEDLDSGRAINKAYGSVYKMNLARGAYELRRAAEGDELVLIHAKANDGPRTRPVGLVIEYDGDVGPIHFRRSEIAAPELARAALSQPEQMEHLLVAGARPPTEIADELGILASNVRTILSRDRQAGQRGKRRRFAELPDGRIGRAAHAY